MDTIKGIYTTKELDLLVLLNEDGKSYKYIAKLLNRNYKGLCKKASDIGLTSNSKIKKTTKIYKGELPKDILVLEEYTGSKIPIEHMHLACGYIWDTTPNSILSGHGCPICNIGGMKMHKETLLYLIYFPSLDLYKVGISTDIKKRLSNLGVARDIILVHKFQNATEAIKMEKVWLNNLKEYLVNTNELISGNTETFKI